MNTQPNGQMPSEIRPTRFRRHTGSNCCPTAAHISAHGQRAKRAGRRETGQNTSAPHPQCRREAPARNRANSPATLLFTQAAAGCPPRKPTTDAPPPAFRRHLQLTLPSETCHVPGSPV
ncbi:TPA: hypothetical protein ACFRHE_000030 [Neisseria lactamica]|uniref:hypothetical protein n=2 Tax=Neisseria lactamica TaxID=486 RepID=UPI000322C6A2|nr:hypothetical protein [Neisseria lactamica]